MLQPSIDARLEAYRVNARLVPEVAGRVIPEPVRSEQEYRDAILEPLYAALAPHDPEGVLRHEWANARGAIARFERGAIEIRVIDSQECPSADLAVVAMIVGLVRALTEERWASCDDLDAIGTDELATLLERCARLGGAAPVTDRRTLRAFGIERSEADALTVWRSLADRLAPDLVPAEYGAALESIVSRGSLSECMVRAHRDGSDVRSIARALVGCLEHDRIYLG